MQRKGWRDSNGEHRPRPHRRHRLGESLNRGEGVGEPGLEGTALVGELQSVGVTPEQSKAKALFQQPHLLAHRSLGDVQVLRRQGEAAVARCRFKGAQSIQKKRAPSDLSYSKIYLGSALDQMIRSASP